METASSPLQLGKYSLIAEIARGGMGIVYLAKMNGPAGFQKLAVVKELKPDLGEDHKFANMFLDEARLCARLNHRNIVQTNEVGEDAGRFYMAMEYLDGRTLQSARARLKGPKALTPTMLVRIACEALSGLHYAHELADYDGRPLGIVHRDVSAHNIFLTYDGQVKVLDFGVAKASANTQETEVGMLKGRVVCMSPEHVDNDRVDRRADVFSMGVLLRETLTGQRVWGTLGEMEVVRELLAKRIPPLPVDSDLAPELRHVIERAMAPRREDRFSNALEMRQALEAWLVRADPGNALSRLGDILAAEFADQRERVKATIEARTREDVEALSELPQLPMGSTPDTSGVSKLSMASFSVASRPNGSPRSETNVSAVISGQTASLPSITAPAPARSSSTLILAGIALVAIAVAATAILMRPHEPAPAPAAAAAAGDARPAPTVTPAPAAAPTSDAVDLTIESTPTNASIFIDGALVENPWHARYPRGGTHEIRVTAAGYNPKVQSVVLGSAMKLDLSLERTAPAAVAPAAIFRGGNVTTVTKAPDPKPAPVSSDPPPAPAPAGTDVSAAGGRAPKRNIDAKNPYQQ